MTLIGSDKIQCVTLQVQCVTFSVTYFGGGFSLYLVEPKNQTNEKITSTALPFI